MKLPVLNSLGTGYSRGPREGTQGGRWGWGLRANLGHSLGRGVGSWGLEASLRRSRGADLGWRVWNWIWSGCKGSGSCRGWAVAGRVEGRRKA